MTEVKKIFNFPQAPHLRNIIGPSFILLGLGLGSGEIILWPFMASKWGMGIIWAALFGISMQFIINMEIERYTLATGESVLVGFKRIFGNKSPYWFLLSSFVPWVWPGIIASSAYLFSKLIGFEKTNIMTVIFLVSIGLIYTLGSYIYKLQEFVNKWIILLGVPFVFILAIKLANIPNLVALGKGVVGIGDGFFLFPKDIVMATFLAAIAYSGAGGNLNLAQSYYIKEKGYGLGKINKDNIEGVAFVLNQKNLNRFYKWWKVINLEHLIVFLITGAVSIVLLSFLSFSIFNNNNISVPEGINFVFVEGQTIGKMTTPIMGSLFLIVTSLMLYGTQFSVFGSTSRILSENILLLTKRNDSKKSLFFLFLWLQIILGSIISLLNFAEPLALVVIGAVLNAFSMFIYSILLNILNNKLLPKQIMPSLFRKIALSTASLFYGSFSIINFIIQLKKLI